MSGWIKLHRKLLDKGFYYKDSEKVHLWIHLLLSANRECREEMLGGKPIKCNPGQFTCGRKQLSSETGISESKIERILTYFEQIEQQIEQQKTTKNRLITILSWKDYQQIEQQIEQQLNNNRTTSEQQLNTLQEYKKIKKKKNIEIIDKSIDERKSDFKLKVAEFLNITDKVILDAFFKYWTEPNQKTSKMRFEDEKYFDVTRRLQTWIRNENKYKNGQN